MPSASSSDALPWRAEAGGVLLVTVRLTPRGGRDGLDGIAVLSDGRPVVKARVRVAAEDGAANAALMALLARAAGLAPSAASLRSGHRMRLKTVALAGETSAIAARLAAALGGVPHDSDRGQAQ